MRTPAACLLALAAAFSAAFSAASAAAFEVPEADVHVVDAHRVDGAALVLNNAVLFEATVLAIDVYVAALYLTARTARPDEILACAGPQRLDLRFMRDVDRDQLVPKWRSEVERRARRRKALDRHRPAIDALFASYPGVREGQIMSFTWRPAHGLEVAVDGRVRGLVASDASFCELFFSGFVGKEALYPTMREGLLARPRPPAAGATALE